VSAPGSLAAPPPAAAGRLRSLAAGRRFRLLRVYRTTFRILLSYGLFSLARRVRGSGWAEGAAPRVHRHNARRAMRTIVTVQGLFIKVGQLVSILSNFLPTDFRDELAGLQDRIPPRPWEEIRGRLAAELGAEPESRFAAIDREPIAAASLAQVHAARLADGRRVAVKVQHLDIERLARLDLATVRRILGLVGLFTGARDLDGLFDEVSALIGEELDFVREADHIEEIAANFADDPMIDAPPVVRELSTPRVLVTGFVDGVKVTDTEALDARGIDREALAERVLRAYCRMIFVDGVYHGDPHPGNILVRDDGSVVFIDFGAVGRLSRAMKEGIPKFLAAVLRRDRDEILRALERMGFVQRRPGEQVAERVIAYFTARLLEGLEFEEWNLEDVHVDLETKFEVMADLRRLDLLLRDLTATFQVPREWILLLRTLVLLLGVCTHLDPEMRPMAVVRPYVEPLVLGEDRDWLRLVRSFMGELAMTALTLPGDLKRLLTRAERGEAVIEVGGLRESATLLYALGHQLLSGGLALGTGALAYLARAGGDAGAADALGWACAFFLLCLGGSLWQARRWQRRVRRGAARPSR
jgi:predicted unusual protein kinase regulating ubiquinone biosynthesis (AarF/ABC1/UbiB family)